jgi:hypothetical protein
MKHYTMKVYGGQYDMKQNKSQIWSLWFEPKNVLAIRLESNICKTCEVSTSPTHALICIHGQSQRGGPPDGELYGW